MLDKIQMWENIYVVYSLIFQIELSFRLLK